MFSERSASWLSVVMVGVFCGLCLSIAGAQSAPGVAQGVRPSEIQLSLQEQTKARELRRGPVTPAELALKGVQKNANKIHAFATGMSLANSIFLSALDYDSAGQETRSVAAADLNNDGFVDLVTADSCATNNCSGGSISVLLGNGDGTFQAAVSYGSGGEDATSVAIGDVNHDGKPDVVVVNNCSSNSNCSNGSVSVLLGNGDGTFQSAVSYSSGGEDSLSIAVADVNGDGYPDLLVANDCVSNNCTSGSVSVLLGKGDGTFNAAVSYGSGGQGAMFVVVGDVNGDGKPDLAVANQCVSNSSCSNGVVSVLLGNGDGTFNTAVNYNAPGLYSESIAIGDVNGDGHLDLVAANQCNNSNDCSEGSLSVFLGNGDGTFRAAVGYPSGGENATSIALADINADGKPDLLVANQTDSNGDWTDGSVSSVLMGNGDGTFQTAVNYGSGAFNASAMAVADVNGDGKPDLLMASGCANNYNCTTGAVSVLLGNGDGTLRGGVNYSPGGWTSYSVAVADVNGDGKLDLLLANQCASNNSCTNGTASVLLGNGDGTFQAGVSYNSGGMNGFSILAADVNGDGKPDLLIVNECTNNNCSNGSVGVLLGNGDGTFPYAVAYGSGGLYPYS